jgi:hypothetical protein
VLKEYFKIIDMTKKEDCDIKPKTTEYVKIHMWLYKNYGKANHCDHCNLFNLNYDYALIKGETHSRDRSHYMQLCKSCHRKYDYKQEQGDRVKKWWKDRPEIRINKRLPWHVTYEDHPRAKPIRMISIDGTVEVFTCLKRATDKYGFKPNTLSMCLTGRNRTAYGNKWEYV